MSFNLKFYLISTISLLPMLLHSQSISVTVQDKGSGEPLYNAHAYNHRTHEGRVADLEGRISLAGVTRDSITISYVGYRDTLLVVKTDRTAYTITLSVRPMD